MDRGRDGEGPHTPVFERLEPRMLLSGDMGLSDPINSYACPPDPQVIELDLQPGQDVTQDSSRSHSLDTTAPQAGVNKLWTLDRSPPLTGTVDDPEAAIEVTIAGLVYPATNNGDGTWTLPQGKIAPELADGIYEVQVLATDKAGNSTCGTPAELLIGITSRPWSFIESFDQDLPGSAAGWEYYSTNQGRIRSVDGRLTLDDAVADTTWSLNEAILHLDLSSLRNVTLTFDHLSLGDEWMPIQSVSVNHTMGDGVALSVDGVRWFRISDLAGDFTAGPFDLEALLTKAFQTTPSADRSNVRIKFQQYDDNPVPSDGRQFDNIRVQGLSAPGIQVSGAGRSIRSGDQTPEAGDLTDFGQVMQDEPDPTHIFTIQNTGQGILVIESVEVPAGFRWIHSGGTIALWPGESYEISVRLDADQVGTYSGDVRIATHVPDQALFAFRIKGEVVGAPPVVNGFSVADPSHTTAGYTNQREVRVSLTENDPDGSVAGWMITETPAVPGPGSPGWLDARPASYVIQGYGDGLKRLYAWVKDNRGNVSAKTAGAQAEITLDQTPPDVAVSSAITCERSPGLRIFTTEQAVSVVVRVDGKDYAAIQTGNMIWELPAHTIAPPLVDGIYNVQATAVDLAGNVGTDTTVEELTLDTIPPVVTILPCISNVLRPGLNGTVDDPSASVRVIVKDGGYDAVNNGDGTWTLKAQILSPYVTDGVYDVVVTATDRAGNKGTDSTASELTIDQMAPSLIHSTLSEDTGTQDDKETRDNTPVLTLTFSEPVFGLPSDIVVLDVKNNPVRPDSVTGWGTDTLVVSFTSPLTVEGAYAVVLKGTTTIRDVTSHALNDGQDHYLLFCVDTVAPTVTVDPLTTSDLTPELTGQVSDYNATVEVRIAGIGYQAVNEGGGFWRLADGSITTALACGTYDVMVRATDKVGNVGQDDTTEELEIVEWDLTDDAVTVAEDGGATAVDVLVNDAYVPDPKQGLVITAKTDGAQGGKVEIVDGGKGMTYTPPKANFTGEDTFTYTASDDEGRTDTASVTMTVTPVNDPPTLTSVQLLRGATKDFLYKIGYESLAAAANEADMDGDVVRFRIQSIGSGTFRLTKAGVTVTPGTQEALLGPGETWEWYPLAGKMGEREAFTIRAWDGKAASGQPVQVNVLVDPVPDLRPISVESSVWQSAEPGTMADWGAVIRNNGPGPQWAEWTVEWVLSSDRKYQAGDTLIGTATYQEDIPAKDSVNVSCSAAVPVVQTAGQMYLIARVINAGPDRKASNDVMSGKDRDWFGEAVPDGDEENDTRQTAKDLGYVAGTTSQTGKTIDDPADTDWYRFTTLATAGRSHKVRIDFSNAEGDLALALYRADGSLIREMDGSGQSEQISLSGLVEGTYFIRVWSNLGDVSKGYKLTIVAPTGPGLQPTAVDSGVWQSAEPGTAVDWTVTVKNNGPGRQWADWTVEWYLSTDKRYQAGDTLVATATYQDDIAPRASVSQTLNAVVPDVPTVGQKYVIARAVNAGPEAKTGNDTKASADRDWFGPVDPDGDEANNTFETASNLGAFTGKLTRSGRTIDSIEDVDWYQFTTQRTGTSGHKIRIDFSSTEGDLALALYRSDGSLLQLVDRSGNSEEIKLTGLLQGTYYLQVLSHPQDVCRSYKLTVLI